MDGCRGSGDAGRRVLVLTYCTNLPPGEAWSDVRRNLETHALAVKRSVSPDDPFPLGLRISGRAASELDENEIARFHEWLAEHECSVPTLNGFPHGRFHGAGVKERVYLPDWRTPERAEYTRRLGDILAGWLPEGVKGSISTAPVAFARDFDAREWDAVRRHWTESVAHLARLRDERGVEIVLALEPEPACVVERSEQVLARPVDVELGQRANGFQARLGVACLEAIGGHFNIM